MQKTPNLIVVVMSDRRDGVGPVHALLIGSVAAQLGSVCQAVRAAGTSVQSGETRANIIRDLPSISNALLLTRYWLKR